MDIVRFVNPDMLWLSALIVPMVAYYVYRMRQGGATMRISTIDGVRRVPRTAKYYLRHLPLVLCCLAVALLSVALARPQSAEHNSNSTTEGIDIVLSLDVSGSMLGPRFYPRPPRRGQRGGLEFYRGPSQRPYRVGGVRGREFHPVSADDR